MHGKREHQRESACDGFAVGPPQLAFGGRPIVTVDELESSACALADDAELDLYDSASLVLRDESKRVRVTPKRRDELSLSRAGRRRRIAKVNGLDGRRRLARG